MTLRGLASPRLRHTAPALLLVASGAAALVYEVLWARDWALWYGATATGTALVLAAYFAGLALGSALGARVAADTALRRWAALEGGVAASVVAYLALRPWLPGAAAWLSHTTAPAVLPAAQLALVAAVLLPTTTLLGATLPAAAAAFGGDGARLYAWNTLGGAAGAVLTAVLLVHVLGVRGSYLAAATVNVAVAGGAMALAGVSRALPARVVASASRPTTPSRAALAATAVCGAIGLGAEVLWTRGLAGVLSNSVYSIAIVLAATLVGIVAGAALAARRRDGDPLAALARVAAALALALVGSLLAIERLPALSRGLIRAFRVAGPTAGFAVEATLALGIVLVPATLLGAAFACVLRAMAPAPPGRGMGHALAANTLGGLAGALGAAFVLLPRLGLGGGLLALAAGAVVLAATLDARAPAIAAAALVAGTAIAGPDVRVPWREQERERLLFYRDGATATVMVTADTDDAKRLRVNGQYALGGGTGLLLERRQAHLPLLLHPAPLRLLALGVGTGDTAGAALAHPGVAVDGVELVPEVLEAARLFARENDGVLDAPRARLVAADARSFLLTTTATWDVILSDLFLPWTAGTASLYAREFYRLGLERLAPGGLYVQWLPLHQLAVPDLEAIVATFVTAFPHAQLWLAYHRAMTPLAALVGSATPIATDADALRARLASPGLGAAGFVDPRDLAVLYVADGRALRTVTAGVAPITDDRPRLEFSAPAAYFHQQDLARQATAWVAARLDPGDGPIRGAPAPFALRRALVTAQLALLAGDRPAELAAYAEALHLAPDLPAVREALTAIAAERRAAGDARTAAVIDDALARRGAR